VLLIKPNHKKHFHPISIVLFFAQNTTMQEPKKRKREDQVRIHSGGRRSKRVYAPDPIDNFSGTEGESEQEQPEEEDKNKTLAVAVCVMKDAQDPRIEYIHHMEPSLHDAQEWMKSHAFTTLPKRFWGFCYNDGNKRSMYQTVPSGRKQTQFQWLENKAKCTKL